MTMEKEQAGAEIVLLVGEMVRALVDDPESAGVLGRYDGGYVSIDVTVAAGDVGKVIGKQGRTVRSLRAIVAAASSRSKVRCELNIHGDKYEAGREVA